MELSHDSSCLVVSTHTRHVVSGAILTAKTQLMYKYHLGRNDHQLKLYTKINFVGTIIHVMLEI